MWTLQTNIPFMLELLKLSFLALHFSYSLLVTFLKMLSVILLSMLYDTNFYSTCDQAYDLWQQLKLAFELESHLWYTVDWGRKWLVDFNSGKAQLVLFDRSNNTDPNNVKIDRPFTEEKSWFKILQLSYASKLNWNSYVVFIHKTVSNKAGVLIRSMKFFSLGIALYLNEVAIRLCMEYCCHFWAGALSCPLETLDKLRKRICRTVGPSRAASLEPLDHRQTGASLSLFRIVIILGVVHLKWLNWFNFFILEGGLLVILIDCMIFLHHL